MVGLYFAPFYLQSLVIALVCHRLLVACVMIVGCHRLVVEYHRPAMFQLVSTECVICEDCYFILFMTVTGNNSTEVSQAFGGICNNSGISQICGGMPNSTGVSEACGGIPNSTGMSLSGGGMSHASNLSIGQHYSESVKTTHTYHLV